MAAPTDQSTKIPDLTDPQTFADGVPHEVFDVLREREGLYWQPASFGTRNGGFWAVTRYADIVEIEKNSADFTITLGNQFPGSDGAFAALRDDMLVMDPPRHTKIRRAATAAFTPRVVANFDPWIREIVNEILDETLPLGEFDYIEAVARHLPARVIARVMGIPREQRERIVKHVDAVFAATMAPDAGVSMFGVMEGFFGYAQELQDTKLRDPQDDMVTALAQLVEKGDLDQNQYEQYVQLLVMAGYETTHTLIGQSMRMVVEDPEVAAATDKAIADGNSTRLVDEFLRYTCPVMNMVRCATRDMEMFGETIRKDDVMQLFFTAGNRDPAVFSEPHRFNPSRPETATLSFGSGAHKCIASALAKLEVSILFEELHARGVRLELNGEPRRGENVWINQLHSLPVRVIR